MEKQYRLEDFLECPDIAFGVKSPLLDPDPIVECLRGPKLVREPRSQRPRQPKYFSSSL